MAANPELVDYVRQQMKSGYGEQQIRDMLIQTGWQPHEVDDAFKEAKGGSASLGIKDEQPEPVRQPEQAQRPEEPGKGRLGFLRKEERKAPEQKPEEKELMQKPLFQEKGSMGLGFILSLIAGILIIFNGLYAMFIRDLTDDILTVWNMTLTLLTIEGSDMLFGLLSIIVGALIIVFYLVLTRMGKPLVAGILVLVLSAVALLAGGFFVGAGVGIIAGIMVILKK